MLSCSIATFEDEVGGCNCGNGGVAMVLVIVGWHYDGDCDISVMVKDEN